MFDDDAPVKRKGAHEIGCDLSAISVDELQERVGLLREEIARLEAAIAEKARSRDAAASVFKL
ncbi:MAG: DUF1192 domain-containing protein [Flavobacteriaceae bacterium]